MTKNGNIMDASMFASYRDINSNILLVTSNTLVGDHYVVKFSDNIYRINYACGNNSALSWIFIPSTVAAINDSACSGIDDPEENVRYIGDKTVSPGDSWPWDTAM